MNPRQQILAKLLTYAGAAPFVFAAYAASKGSAVAVTPMVLGYAAVILSFLAGIHWAIHLFFAPRCPRNLLLTSNAMALVAWLALLIVDTKLALLLHLLAFPYMLLLDWRLRNVMVLPAWFYGLRRNATLIVVASLAVVLACQ
jgi:hypothetical protein